MNFIEKCNIGMKRLKPHLISVRLPLVVAVISTLGLYAFSGSTHDDETPAVELPPIDTLVPEGHVLVPIEVSNLEALGSVVGPYGIVDLYALDAKGHELSKVGSHLKMVRSLEQPSFISVLVPEEEAFRLLATKGPFQVAVLNSQKIQSPSEVHKAPRSRIYYRDKVED